MYHRAGKNKSCQQILEEALRNTDKKQNPHLFDTESERISAYNSLACYYLMASEFNPDADISDKEYASGMNNINHSDNLNLTVPETWITKSFFLIS